MLLGCVWLLYHCACFVLYGVMYSGTFPDVILVHREFFVRVHKQSRAKSTTLQERKREKNSNK